MYGWLSPVYLAKLIAIAKAWPLTKVYGYTHFPARVWAEAVRELAPPNFVLYESISEKPAVPATCWRTARVVDVIDDVASDEYVCPYDLAKMLGHKRIKVTCDTCMACPKGDKNIVFPLI